MPASPFSRIWFGLMVLALVVLLCLSGVEAGSRAPKPIKRIYHPHTISLDIIPRSIPSHPGKSSRKRSELPSTHLLSSDALRLSLSLPTDNLNGEDDIIHLHLQPTEYLIHQQAKLNILNGDGSVSSTRPLFRDEDSHRLYSGEVISPEKSDKRLREDKLGGLWYHPLSGPERGVRGWASIHVYDDGRGSVQDGEDRVGKPSFAGAIQLDGKVWHILTKENYLRHKGESDPEVVEESEDGEIVMFLEGDVKHDHGLQSGESRAYETCGHDKNEWNRNASIHQGGKVDRFNNPSPWWLPSSDLTYPDLHPATNPSLDFSFSSPHQHHSNLKIKRQADTPTGGTATPSTNYINNIGQTTGCPTEQRIVYVGMVADSNYVRVYGSEEAARTQILTNMNSVSTLYRQTFNISLGVIEINVISNTSSEASSLAFNQGCSNAYTLNQRLSDFSSWRGSQSSDAGLYHLMTACGTDSEIGVAWLGAVCQTGSSSQASGTVSGTGVSVAMRSEWSLNAHEMGHNFGAIHDCWDGCSLQGSCCPRSSDSCNAGGGYIMNPSTSADNAQVAFSPCSIGNICSLMQARALDYSCIESPGSRTVLSLQSCGNGILEEGEDCDPGQNSTSNCCDAATCKFINGAVCDPATDLCCTDQCGYASNSTLCRPATDERCDIAEYCTGNSRSCPADETRGDGTSCGSNGLACASGQCTSNDVQCQTVGASYNLTRACGQRNDRSCVVSCQQGSNQCLQLPTPLIDGSPCGYGGKCYNGTCSNGSAGDTVSNWYRQNLNIAIPVTVVAGILVLLFAVLIGRCIWRGCCGGTPRKQRRPSNSQQRASRAAAGASYASTAPMRQSQNHGYGQGYPQQPPQQYQPPPTHPSRQSQYGQYGQPPQYNQYGQYNNGGQYGGGGGVPPPPPARPGRDHYVDDSLYNGPNYRE